MFATTRNLTKLLAIPLLVAAGCGSDPKIDNTKVTPSNFQVSGISSTATFTISTDVLHLGGNVTSVTAKVQDHDATYTLQKSGGTIGGETWSVSTNFTFWTGISSGTYYIDITAKDDTGTTVTQAKAASFTVSD